MMKKVGMAIGGLVGCALLVFGIYLISDEPTDPLAEKLELQAEEIQQLSVENKKMIKRLNELAEEQLKLISKIAENQKYILNKVEQVKTSTLMLDENLQKVREKSAQTETVLEKAVKGLDTTNKSVGKVSKDLSDFRRRVYGR